MDANIFDNMGAYDELLKNGKDPFAMMLKKQLELQVDLSSKNKNTVNPEYITSLGEIYDWLRDNKLALDDEFREVIDALPGIDTPVKERSGIWKKWKSNHNAIRSKTLDDLTDEELFNLKEEFVDLWHFVMNMMLVLKIDPKTLFAIYCYKNNINHKRYDNGY